MLKMPRSEGDALVRLEWMRARSQQQQQQFSLYQNAKGAVLAAGLDEPQRTAINMAGELGKVHLPLEQLEETLSKLTVPELQQRLKKRGLRKSGIKAKLIQRLAEAIESENAEEEEQEGANVDLNIDEGNDGMVENLDESAGTTDSNAVESAAFHDPYDEFESSMPSVAEVEQNKKINETSTENADVTEHSIQNDNLNSATGFASQRDETYGSITAPDVLPSDSGSGAQELVPPSSGQGIGTSEGKYNEEDEEDIQQCHLNSQPEGPETQNTAHHESEAEFAQMKKPVDETQVEDGISQEEESEGMSTEIAKDDIATEEQIDTQSNVVESDNFKACQDESEEVGIEIGLGKDEKEDFTAHEGDEGQEQDVSMKQEMKQKKKKVTAPVQLKKRRNITEEPESKQDTPVPRKRRWGSSRSNESLTISSESLKGLIPDVSMIPTPNEDPLGIGLDYCEVEEGEIDEVVEARPHIEADSEANVATEADVSEEGNFKKEVRKGRIVRISTKDTVKLSRVESKEDEEEKEEVKNEIEKDTEMEVTIPEEKVSLLPEVPTEDPEYVGERPPSPAKNPPGRVLSIRNLVRPFTLRQLREFLSKAGTVMEEEFWIDRIKSHCYVTYETVDEAVASRSVIHGARWPAANPKLLSADFAINDEMYKETEGKLGTAPTRVRNEMEKPPDDKTEEVPKKREKSSEKERKRHSRSQDKEKKVEVSAKPKEKKEAPGKLLDDLFRKTKALPCIYWLPLSKEQVTAKEKEREQRREERRILHEKQEADVHPGEASVKQREIEAERRERERNRQGTRAGRPTPDYYRNRKRLQSS